MTGVRVLVAGSRRWTDETMASDVLHACFELTGSTPRESTLLPGGAAGADALLSSSGSRLGMSVEPRLTNTIPPSDLCLVVPSHGQQLPAGADPAHTSRSTWAIAESASAAGIPTIVLWSKQLYPFGAGAEQLLSVAANRRDRVTGRAGELSVLDAWLPF